MYSASEHKSWLENRVQTALNTYMETGSASAGYDVMRYAKKGYYSIKDYCKKDAATEMFAWYPMPMGFAILRLAKSGKLYFSGV